MITTGLHAHMAVVRVCYQPQLAKHTGLKGKFDYEIVVDAHGKVKRAKPVTPSAVPELDACLVKAFTNITFFSVGPAMVRFPFVFFSS